MYPEPQDIVVIGPNASDVFSWPITSRMADEAWYHGDDAGTLDCPHSKSGVWPVWMLTPDQPDPTPAEGNIWAVFLHGGVWYARTLHYLRPGQTRKLKPRGEWSTDKENMPIPASWPGPQRGDSVGMFVSTRARYGLSQTQERSDLVWTRYGLPGILARETEAQEPTEPDEPDNPVPGDIPGAPLPSQDDESAWRERVEAKLDTIVTLLSGLPAMGEGLVGAVTATSSTLQAELAKGLKIRWR